MTQNVAKEVVLISIADRLVVAQQAVQDHVDTRFRPYPRQKP